MTYKEEAERLQAENAELKAHIERWAEIDERHVLSVRGPKHVIQIYQSPTGKSMRVFKDGRELK